MTLRLSAHNNIPCLGQVLIQFWTKRVKLYTLLIMTARPKYHTLSGAWPRIAQEVPRDLSTFLF